jgi:hypothetical protein
VYRVAKFRALSCILILTVFIGGLPALSGVVIAADSHPALMLDICHPLQTPTVSTLPFFVPPLAGFRASSRLLVCDYREVAVYSRFSRFADAPDPPPPKLDT